MHLTDKVLTMRNKNALVERYYSQCGRMFEEKLKFEREQRTEGKVLRGDLD